MGEQTRVDQLSRCHTHLALCHQRRSQSGDHTQKDRSEACLSTRGGHSLPQTTNASTARRDSHPTRAEHSHSTSSAIGHQVQQDLLICYLETFRIVYLIYLFLFAFVRQQPPRPATPPPLVVREGNKKTQKRSSFIVVYFCFILNYN